MRRIFRSAARVIYGRRQLLALLATVVVSVAAYAAAFVVRFEMRWPAAYTGAFLSTIGWLVAFRIGVSYAFRLNAQRWRYSSVTDLGEITLAMLISSMAFFAF